MQRTDQKNLAKRLRYYQSSIDQDNNELPKSYIIFICTFDYFGYDLCKNENVALKSKGELIKNIHKKVEYIKDDRGIEVEFMTLLERDMENREEGFLEGMEKGIKKGIEKGKAEGKLEGKEEEKVIVTGKLLERGLSLDEISDITGLTIEKIEEIKKEIE